MFGKILKWDFRNQITNIFIMLAATLFCLLGLGISQLNISFLTAIFYNFSILIGIVSVFFVMLNIYIYMAKNLYGDQGYLHHQIPVKTSVLWHSKVISGLFYIALSLATLLLNLKILSFYKSMSNGEEASVFAQLELLFSSLNISNGQGYTLVTLIILSFIVWFLYAFGLSIIISNKPFLAQYGNLRYLIGYGITYFMFQILYAIIIFIIPFSITAKNGNYEFIKKPLFMILDQIESVFPLGILIGMLIITIASAPYIIKQLNHKLNLN